MSPSEDKRLRAGMVGMGMIFDETYRPFFEQAHARGVYDPVFGVCQVPLVAVASKTGSRAEAFRATSAGKVASFQSFKEPDSIGQLLKSDVDFVCVATPDNRHFDPAAAALRAAQLEMVEGGLSSVENRVFMEVADCAGAARMAVWVGHDLSDHEVLEKLGAA